MILNRLCATSRATALLISLPALALAQTAAAPGVTDLTTSNAAAIEVAIAAHRDLLQSSENFWLTSWLSNQLKVLRQRLD